MRSNDDVGSSAGDYSLDLRRLGLGADVRFVPKADARGSNCNRCYCRKLRIFASSLHSTAAASWLCAERFEFVIRSNQLKGIFWTPLLSNPEQASSLVFAALLQRQFTAEEIGLANLALLFGSIAVRSCGKHSLWCHLAKVEADNRRRPLCHVDLRRGLGKPAGQLTARVHDVEPQRRIRVFRIECTSLIDVGQGLGKVTRVETQQSASKIGLKKFGIELDCLIIVGDGASDLALVSVCVAAVAISHGEFGIKPNRLVTIGNRPVVIAFVKIRIAKIVVGHTRLRIELDRLIVVSDGPVEIVLITVRLATVEVSVGQFWIEPDRFVTIGNGSVRVAFVGISPTAVAVASGTILRRRPLGFDQRRTTAEPLINRKQIVVVVTPIDLLLRLGPGPRSMQRRRKHQRARKYVQPVPRHGLPPTLAFTR